MKDKKKNTSNEDLALLKILYQAPLISNNQKAIYRFLKSKEETK